MVEKTRSNETGTTYSKSESGRELAYVDEFKQLIHNNPGILASFLKFDKIVKNEKESGKSVYGEIFQDKDIKLTVLNHFGEAEEDINRSKYKYYIKAEVGGKNYFVKSVPVVQSRPELEHGIEEFQSVRKAKDLVRGLSNVEVIDFQLGYHDESGHTYFVSKWVDGVNLRKYVRGPISIAEHDEIIKRVSEIQKVLGEFYREVVLENMIYDPNSKKITIFDIHRVEK